ncbi:ATP synthase F0 subunit 8 (mitochondrion) [Colius striatus]|uniref:ATP synthase complex subunit 8 n=1 Tax=Colius striatus TaxID=57412 RepID=A0A7G9TUR7_COLST|nr:ATP synthase F0 subunit 8 [Colius striatus]QNN84110.1 ATP synthase F0 subunit 8 [Colius striatus]
MPQLNPNPWFFIMLITWLVFALTIQPKLLSFISPNPPLNKSSAKTKTTSWTWPWT